MDWPYNAINKFLEPERAHIKDKTETKNESCNIFAPVAELFVVPPASGHRRLQRTGTVRRLDTDVCKVRRRLSAVSRLRSRFASSNAVPWLRVRQSLGIFMKQRGEIKIYCFLIQSLVELKNIRYLFLPSLCTTSPVAVFRFWVTSSICLKSKPPGLLFFFCFYTECQSFGLWMTCALVLELYG